MQHAHLDYSPAMTAVRLAVYSSTSNGTSIFWIEGSQLNSDDQGMFVRSQAGEVFFVPWTSIQRVHYPRWDEVESLD